MSFSMNARLSFTVPAIALVLMTSPLHATVIVAGQTNLVPEAFNLVGDPPILDEIQGNFNFGNGALFGSYDVVVLVDPLGITCAGCLDFAFAINIDPESPDFAFSVNLSRFFGYSTNAGYVTGTGGPGALDPIGVSRGPAGGGVGFAFTNGASVLTPGSGTDFLVIGTNATTYDKLGSLSISGGHDSNAANNITGIIAGVFEPTFIAPVPEPSTVVLLSLGLLGIPAFRRRTVR
jgi:hypothetical protein